MYMYLNNINFIFIKISELTFALDVLDSRECFYNQETTALQLVAQQMPAECLLTVSGLSRNSAVSAVSHDNYWLYSKNKQEYCNCDKKPAHLPCQPQQIFAVLTRMANWHLSDRGWWVDCASSRKGKLPHLGGVCVRIWKQQQNQWCQLSNILP